MVALRTSVFVSESNEESLDSNILESMFSTNVIESWNKIQEQLKDMLLKDLSPRKVKTIVSNFYLKSY